MKKEGHEVKMWIRPGENDDTPVGNGFIEKIKSLREGKEWANFIIFDDGEMGEIADQARKDGKVVWGGSEISDRMEMERGYGQKIFKEIGMTTIPSKEFKNVEEARSFVASNPKRYVVKPSGTIQNEKALTYCGKEEDGSDLMIVLDNYQKKWSHQIEKIELQDFVKGVEFGVSGFFNGRDFVLPIEGSFEHKKLMNGNIGPSTGEMGTSQIWMNKNKIYRETIGRSVSFLSKSKATGYVDINCIVTKDKVLPLEWTIRFGYPTLTLALETIKGDIGKTMFEIAFGKNTNFSVSYPYSIVVVLATPPYPFTSSELYRKYGEDQEIIFSTKDRTGYWPEEVKKEGERWFVTGASGFTLMVTGSGNNINEARKMVYERIKKVTIPNMFYRTDIGDKTDENLSLLNSYGWFQP